MGMGDSERTPRGNNIEKMPGRPDHFAINN